jgi:multiple sugar transport system permease protein
MAFVTDQQSFYQRLFNRHKFVLFILPAVIFVVVMMVFPVIYNGWLSLNQWTGSALQPPRFVGLENYQQFFTSDERFFDAVIRTFVFTIGAVTVQLILGLGIALLLHGRFPGQNVIKTLILLPMVATPVAIGMAWLLMYEPTIGVFNHILRSFGMQPQPWLGSQSQALICLIVVDVWQWTPMMTMILLAGLATLPEEPFEAARVDGAGPFQRFSYLVLPMLMPTILTALLLRSIEALKTFDIIYTMTRGGPGFSTETLNTYAYVQSFEYFRMGRASSLLVIFFAIVLGVSLIFVQLRNIAEARRA